MTKMIFVNLPVADVPRATAYYEALGFTKNPMFSSEQASSMQWSDAIVVMLLDRAFFATFTTKRIADARSETSTLLSLSCDSRAEVDTITDAAITAGGHDLHDPEDLGFMYSRAFEDLDGHGWGTVYVDMAAAAQGMPPPTNAG